ncbi:MAG: hypothetical protein WCO86_17780, partial [Planctomycetota bacterium]
IEIPGLQHQLLCERQRMPHLVGITRPSTKDLGKHPRSGRLPVLPNTEVQRVGDRNSLVHRPPIVPCRAYFYGSLG